MKLLLTSIAISTLALTGCAHTISTETAEVTVIVDKPYLLGHGGVRPEPQKTGRGWYFISTEGYDFPTSPFKVGETFDDLSTSKNNFIDYNSNLTLQITDAVKLYQSFGGEWYKNSLQAAYQKIVRDVVRQYTFDDIMTNPTTQTEIDNIIQTKTSDYIKQYNIPVRLIDVSLGKATPNEVVKDEMNRTAAETQRFKTLEQTVRAEEKRAESEQKRALADNSYRNQMGLNTEEFVKLKYIEEFSSACKYSTANCIIGTVPSVIAGK